MRTPSLHARSILSEFMFPPPVLKHHTKTPIKLVYDSDESDSDEDDALISREPHTLRSGFDARADSWALQDEDISRLLPLRAESGRIVTVKDRLNNEHLRKNSLTITVNEDGTTNPPIVDLPTDTRAKVELVADELGLDHEERYSEYVIADAARELSVHEGIRGLNLDIQVDHVLAALLRFKRWV